MEVKFWQDYAVTTVYLLYLWEGKTTWRSISRGISANPEGHRRAFGKVQRQVSCKAGCGQDKYEAEGLEVDKQLWVFNIQKFWRQCWGNLNQRYRSHITKIPTKRRGSAALVSVDLIIAMRPTPTLKNQFEENLGLCRGSWPLLDLATLSRLCSYRQTQIDSQSQYRVKTKCVIIHVTLS